LCRLGGAILTESHPKIGAVRRAIDLDPTNDLYRVLLAQRLEESGHDAMPIWREALRLNPRRSLTLTQAAVSAEAAGDTPTAEHLLLQAAHYNQLWLPRWSLVNFYARHSRRDDLLKWSRLALERAHTGQTPVFLQCREAGATNATMLRDVVPASPRNMAPYLFFLINSKDYDSLPAAAAAYLAATRAARTPSSEVATTLSWATGALIEARRGEEAVAVWNSGLPSRWSEQSPLINAQLAKPVTPPGLDWALKEPEGIEANLGVIDHGAKFTFSGRQPEAAELLAQTLYLPGDAVWTLRFEAQTRNLNAGESGLGWRLTALDDGAVMEPTSPPQTLEGDDWRQFAVSWRALPGRRLYRLALRIDRVHGRVRAEGELLLRELSFARAEAQR